MKKKILSLILIAVMTFSFTGTAFAEEKSDVQSNAWMSAVADDAYLSSISIPGTHDSGTQFINLSYILKCQNLSIADQLKCGVRYLDVRVAVDEIKDGDNQLKLIHSVGDCKKMRGVFAEKLHFDDVVDQAISFLDENPTETVIMCIKAENSDDSVAEVQKLMYQVIDQNSDYWYTSDEIPTLGEVRGKIVLATRFADEIGVGSNRTGMQFFWEDQGEREIVEIPYNYSQLGENAGLWVQDKYNYDVPDKFEAVKDALGNCMADDNTFFLNFVSTSGSGKIGHPKKYAKVLNRELKNYEFTSGTCYGVVIFDFVNQEMAELVYSTNY